MIPTPTLSDYEHTMLLFYLQEHDIPFSAIDYVEVSLIKDKKTKKIHKHIKIIKLPKNESKNIS